MRLGGDESKWNHDREYDDLDSGDGMVLAAFVAIAVVSFIGGVIIGLWI